VVKTAISQVQGTITVESRPGAGTTVRIKLPLTLAVVGVLLVRERSLQFALPIQQVDQIVTVRLQDVRRLGENVIWNYRGATLQITTLSAILDFPPSRFDGEAAVVILSEGEKRIGVLVDAVLGRQDVLIKSLGRLIQNAPFVMGCTILSDSRLVLILNAWEIVNSRGQAPVLPGDDGAAATAERLAVLVVDDSPIQRNYLAGILEQAGYRVETAENGFEGLKRLRGRRYAAFCVDVVMPLMDGFEFVERLRRTPGYAETPVLFITAKVTQTERDRGPQLGPCDFFRKPIDPDLLLQTLAQRCGPAVAPPLRGEPAGTT
jgi:CheY-like chemotaxis protein/chemotaxis signal transduction protein